MATVVSAPVVHATGKLGATAQTPWMLTLVDGENRTGVISQIAGDIYALATAQTEYYSDANKVTRLTPNL